MLHISWVGWRLVVLDGGTGYHEFDLGFFARCLNLSLLTHGPCLLTLYLFVQCGNAGLFVSEMTACAGGLLNSDIATRLRLLHPSMA